MPERKSRKPATRKVARSTTRTTTRNTAASNRGRTQEASRPTPPSISPAEPHVVARAASLPPHELYRHEKRRRAGQPRGDGRDPLEEARREFKAMLEAGVGTPRGGRPRKVKPNVDDEA
jgi:hypothetical protein